MGRRLQIVIGILLLGALFLGVNMLAGRLVKRARIDATQGSVFTLTQGSRTIARSAEEPIKLTFYFSSTLAQARPEIQTYGKRVRELLEEFQRSSGGKISLEVIDPEPFSEAEDKAVQAGVQGVPVSAAGDNLYFGLVGVNSVETREVVAFFNPEKERFLEYDIARMVNSLAHPKKKIVGYIGGLAIEGGFAMDPRTRQPTQTPAWYIATEIKSVYELRNLGQPGEIPGDVDVLLLIHPKNLPETTLFAIDQYVMKGGKLLAFVDPNCENDDAGASMGMPSQDKASDLSKLLNAWGVEVTPGVFAADKETALQVNVGNRNSPEPMPYVAWLGLKREQFDTNDPITGQLDKLHVASAGAIRAKTEIRTPAPKEGEPAVVTAIVSPATITPLIRTSPKASTMPVAAIGFPPDPKQLFKGFTPGTEAITLAARLTGKVQSAFPSGKPVGETEAAPATPPESLKESTAPINVILVSDCDMLSDAMWVQLDNFFGQRFARMLADNGQLLMASLENLIGGADLISVRARRETARPFTKVEGMLRRAEERGLAEKLALEEKEKTIGDRILQLSQQQGNEQGRVMLTPEVQAEIDKARTERLQTRKQLRELNRTLRADIDQLGSQLKFINIGLMPALVAIGALGLGWYRWSRRR